MTRNSTPNLAAWTAVVNFRSGGDEEIEVRARDARHARRLVKTELRANYNPGGRIVSLGEGGGSFAMTVFSW